MKLSSFLWLTVVPFMSFSAQIKPAIQSSQRVDKIINSNWTFNYFPSNAADKGYESPSYDDSKWFAISIPHTWQTYETTGELHLFIHTESETDNPYLLNGWGWYRKHFSINQAYAGRKVFIEFEGVHKYCKVWINGVYLGDHEGGNGSFDFDITQDIKKSGDNIIAVAVNNPGNDRYALPPMASVNNNVYGGIVRDVSISIRNNLFITREGSASNEGGTIITTPELDARSGLVRIQTCVKNDNTESRYCVVQTSVYDATNKLVQQVRSSADIKPKQLNRFDLTTKPVKNPHLWSPDDPYLYKIVIEVTDGKSVVDTYTTHFGFIIGEKVPGPVNFSPQINNAIISLGSTTNENNESPRSSLNGEPARILLKASQGKISADRGSVVIIHADIVDSKGNHVNGASNTLKWTVSGPATLVGPSLFVSCRDEPGNAWYTGTPADNAIRSTGETGNIKVAVFASGLASGSVSLTSEAVHPDNSVVAEPVLRNEGRTGLDRVVLKSSRLEDIPREIKLSSDAIRLTATGKVGYKKAIIDQIVRNNPAVDTASVEFRVLAELFASYLANNNGQLIADDYNFNVDHYNTCRLISGYINATKLPQPFKDGLRIFYSTSIIREGLEKDAGDEMNWINWIPSGGTVVYFNSEVKTPPVKGTLITTKNELTELITLVHPGFEKFSDDAKERAIGFISKMNPYVRTDVKSEIVDGKNLTITRFLADKGQPVLIPLYKFIAE